MSEGLAAEKTLAYASGSDRRIARRYFRTSASDERSRRTRRGGRPSLHVSFSPLPVKLCSTAIAALARTPFASGGYSVVSLPHALSWSASRHRVETFTVAGLQGRAAVAVARGRCSGRSGRARTRDHVADQVAGLRLARTRPARRAGPASPSRPRSGRPCRGRSASGRASRGRRRPPPRPGRRAATPPTAAGLDLPGEDGVLAGQPGVGVGEAGAGEHVAGAGLDVLAADLGGWGRRRAPAGRAAAGSSSNTSERGGRRAGV